MSRTFDATRLQPVTSGTFDSISSITCWIYNETTENYGALVVNNPNLGFFMRSTGRMSYYAAGDRLSAGSYPFGAWSHFAYTQTGGVGTYYLNGATNGTIASSTSFTIVDIGEDSISETFKGRMWDFRIYNIALTQQEILSCMRGRLVRMGNLTNNTTGVWYPFEGSSSPEPERSRNKRHANITGTNARNLNPPGVTRPLF